MTPRYWSQATADLSARDPVLARLIDAHSATRLRRRGDAFTALARSIVGQQISVRAAAGVWGRVTEAVQEFVPGHVLVLRLEQLRACGLSRQKAAYLLDLAAHFHSGALQPARWRRIGDEQVIAELTQVKGIGRWTAEMFLIFHLLRPDVLPVGDLGLQRAIGLHYNRGNPMSETRMRRVARAWEPWRTVATWYLWRSLEPVPMQS
jgi:DNA-3-methyladenine glycosylase II